MNIKKKTQPIKLFMSHVEFSFDGCWFWTGCLKPGGYGVFRSEGKTHNAHRWSYKYFRGEIPIGLTIDHLCKKQNCVNPYHMEVVTMRENVLRGESPSAKNFKKTHCPEGHPYSEERTKYGKRFCRICGIRRALKWNSENRERKNINNSKYYYRSKEKKNV